MSQTTIKLEPIKNMSGTHGVKICKVCGEKMPRTQYNGRKMYCSKHCRYLGYQVPKRLEERKANYTTLFGKVMTKVEKERYMESIPKYLRGDATINHSHSEPHDLDMNHVSTETQ